MASININGTKYEGKDIKIEDDVVYIDGEKVTEMKKGVKTIIDSIKGIFNSFMCDEGVTIRGNLSATNVDLKGSLNCDDLKAEKISAKGSVNCDDLTGNIEAGGSVNCDNIKGSVKANGSINCDTISGNVSM